MFRSDSNSNEKRNLLVFIHPTIVGDASDVRRLTQRRYDQLYSLQLAMDKDGNFAKLPENVEDVYQQRLPVPATSDKPNVYKQLSSGGVTPVVTTTPVAIELGIGQRSVALPQPEVERTKNTVTTTTLRPAS